MASLATIPRVYFFSGLGADERAFQALEFRGYEPVFIDWVAPLPGESIAAYAGRLLPQIRDDRPLLAGYSFGGIMAIEVAKLIPVQHIVIMGSVKFRSELPPWFRWAAACRIETIIPASWIKKPLRLYYWLFGVTRREDQRLLASIIRDTDESFLEWAIKQILHWQSSASLPATLTHIQGANDRILPARFVRADIVLPGAGHFMVVTHAEALSRILQQQFVAPFRA